MEIGSEVVICPGGPGHRHMDQCFEVRTMMATFSTPSTFSVEVTDLFLGAILVPEVFPAPFPLLARKSHFYERLVKGIRDWEIREQASSGALLDLLLNDVDRYLFCDEFTERHWRNRPVGERSARDGFDFAAHFILGHRRDHGLGLPRYNILKAVIVGLNMGPLISGVTKLVF